MVRFVRKGLRMNAQPQLKSVSYLGCGTFWGHIRAYLAPTNAGNQACKESKEIGAFCEKDLG